LSSLLVDDKLPFCGVGEVDIKGVVALWHGKTANIQIGVCVELRGGIGACPPDRIRRVLSDSSVLAEELANAVTFTLGEL